MAHTPPRRRGAAGDEADRRLVAAAFGFPFQELSRILLGRTADFADHNDGLGLFVREKQLEDRDEIGAFNRIAADADRRGLAEAFLGGLKYGLVGERARARDDTD